MINIKSIQIPSYIRLVASAFCLAGLSLEVLSGHGVPHVLQCLSMGVAFNLPTWVGDLLWWIGVLTCTILWVMDIIARRACLRTSITAIVLAIVLSFPLSLSATANCEYTMSLDVGNFVKGFFYLCSILAVSMYNVLSSSCSANDDK